jgi:hypothetical protein
MRRITAAPSRFAVSHDGDDHGGDDDVIELEIRVSGDEAEEVVARVGATVGGQGEKLGEQRCESRCAGDHDDRPAIPSITITARGRPHLGVSGRFLRLVSHRP